MKAVEFLTIFYTKKILCGISFNKKRDKSIPMSYLQDKKNNLRLQVFQAKNMIKHLY